MGFLLTPPPNVHAQNPTSDFTVPPLDGSLTLPEMYDFHYEHNRDHPVFLYQNAQGGPTRLRYSEVVPAAHRAARILAKIARIDLNADSATFPTIAILAFADTVTYFTILVGLLRAGITVNPISPRNSSLAVANLLSKSRPHLLLSSSEPSIQELAQKAIEHLKNDNSKPQHPPPELHPIPLFDEIYTTDHPFEPLPPRRHDWSRPRLISHSSGSTNFPKPIVWNDRSYLQDALVPHFGAHDFCGEVFGTQGIAIFHAFGLNFIAWLPATGLIMGVFEPASPAMVPTPDSVFNAFVDTSATYLLGVPSFVEEWSKDQKKLEYMKHAKAVAYGGSSLSKTVGDYLTKEGICVQLVYGLTETGLIGMIFPEDPGSDWEYITLNPHCAAEFDCKGDGTYELIIIAKPTQELTIINTKFRGQDAYATSDIMVPHPTKVGRWKPVGRSDDQITLSTGEKTNPVPLESIICQHPQVGSVLIFGANRSHNGIIIEPKKQYAFDTLDEKRLSEFTSSVWPNIEEANALAPTHSRLFKEMILVADASKPFALNTKGYPKRKIILTDYKDEIDSTYDSFERSTNIEPPNDWSFENSKKLVSSVINAILKKSVRENQDVFSYGCDSLQATRIRNSIVHALQQTSSASIEEISLNLVYEHPTIASLSEYVHHVAYGNHPPPGPYSHTPEVLNEFLSRYNLSFPEHKSKADCTDPGKDVVLLTGSTGALGCAVLAKLVASGSVEKIYALNRPSNQGKILHRQQESLKSRGYDENIVFSPKVYLVEGILSSSGLNVDTDLAEEIRINVTHIIHVAWRVDFNLSLASFEDCVAGVRALVDLALSSPRKSPPRVLFTSSVGVYKNLSSQQAVAELPINDPSIPIGQGYAESKWIAERILETAASQTTLRPISVRVAQICGGVNGSWNTSDWVAAIVKSSITLGYLPRFKGICTWIPLDVAADALVEMRNAQNSTIHLANPVPTPANDIFEVFSKELLLPLLPYVDWVKRLDAEIADAVSRGISQSAHIAEKLPAAIIIDFFHRGLRGEEAARETNTDDYEIMGIPRLEMKQALRWSKTLEGSRRINPDDVRRWLAYWRKVSFLP